jgi:hypothetical protein
MTAATTSGMYTSPGDPGELIRMAVAFGTVGAAFLVFGLVMGALWATRRRGQRGRHVAGQPPARGRGPGNVRDLRPQHSRRPRPEREVVPGVPSHARFLYGPEQR